MPSFPASSPTDAAHSALRLVNHIPAMVAYWGRDQRCIFANDAYREWFGRAPGEMVGITAKELLGPMYERNEPYIIRVLQGEKQVFERQIRPPDGTVREAIVNYTPDLVDGAVQGFWVHAADVTVLRERETQLLQTIRERDDALAELRALRKFVPICARCKSIRDPAGAWQSLEAYFAKHTDLSFTHGLCIECMKKFFAACGESDSIPQL